MAWTNTGNIKGPKGDKGDKGDPGVGTKGDPGDPGAPGARGSKWFTGTGAPSGTLTGSQVGDYYLDTTSGTIYELV